MVMWSPSAHQAMMPFLTTSAPPVATWMMTKHPAQNVFGVSSYECLNYAMQNRAEWQDKGEEIVAEMLNTLKKDEL
jgi:hypothetical protein